MHLTIGCTNEVINRISDGLEDVMQVLKYKDLAELFSVVEIPTAARAFGLSRTYYQLPNKISPLA